MIVSSTNGAGQLDTYMLKNKIRPVIITLPKNQTQVIQRLHLKPKLQTPMEENIGSTIYDTGVGNDFLNRTPFAQVLGPQLTPGTSKSKNPSVQ